MEYVTSSFRTELFGHTYTMRTQPAPYIYYGRKRVNTERKNHGLHENVFESMCAFTRRTLAELSNRHFLVALWDNTGRTPTELRLYTAASEL